jgi:hypothetical protein
MVEIILNNVISGYVDINLSVISRAVKTCDVDFDASDEEIVSDLLFEQPNNGSDIISINVVSINDILVFFIFSPLR